MGQTYLLIYRIAKKNSTQISARRIRIEIKMKKIFLISLVLSNLTTMAQQKVWAFFTDKTVTEAQWQHPEKYLSQRSLDRRARQNIALQTSDFPVNPNYVKTLKENGYQVLRSSKWLNAVAIQLAENQNAEALMNFSFVKETRFVQVLVRTEMPSFLKTKYGKTSSLNYGDATKQISQLGGIYLHDQGYQGQGMTIAVIDGGFADANTLGAFDSLWLQNRVLATYDFVDNDTNIFHLGSHGRKVLSIMAGYIDNLYIGVAPKANYVLLKSEDESQETKIEEHNWIAAAEFADSIGADVINSSLGYSTFDGGIGNYTYSDLDGRTTVVSQGSRFAHRKGILHCNSMGNEGNSSWQYMLSPADTDSMLSIGGVDSSGNYVSFASKGPTYDGRLKPNVSAMAAGVFVITVSNTAAPGNGTSFSSPLIAGLAACLWQADTSKTNYEILRLIEQSADRFLTPDTLVGYGIPNFAFALNAISIEENNILESVYVRPNPFIDQIVVALPQELLSKEVEVQLLSLDGKLIVSTLKTEGQGKVIFKGLSDLPHGIYLLQLSTQTEARMIKLLH